MTTESPVKSLSQIATTLYQLAALSRQISLCMEREPAPHQDASWLIDLEADLLQTLAEDLDDATRANECALAAMASSSAEGTSGDAAELLSARGEA